MTNTMMQDARNAIKVAQEQFEAIRKEAARSAMEEIVKTGKSMTRRDIADITGLTTDEVSRYMDEYVYEQRVLNMDLKALKHTYVLVEDNGSVNFEHTITMPYKGYVYSARPGAAVVPSEKINTDIVMAFFANLNK